MSNRKKIVYRISSEKYSKTLSSSGQANRWNKDGQYVIYAAESRSLASLELVVHRAAIRPHLVYKVLLIELDVSESQILKVNHSDLPENWRSVQSYNKLQEIGSDWYLSKKKLILKIPSAVIPFEYNFVINTKHELYTSKVKIIKREDFFWDNRLLEP